MRYTIANEIDVANFFKYVVFELELGIGFHPDTSFEDYINKDTDAVIFSDLKSAALNKVMDKCFDVCETMKIDIYQIALETIQPLLNQIPNTK